MQKLESKATHHYAGILACAPDDRSFFAAHNAEQKPIILIPNGVDGQAYKPDASIRARIRQELGLRSEDRLIVFSGSRYKPNLDALSELRNFALRQRDFLRSQHFKFLILGSMTEAMRSDTLIATGFVPSVLPYFQAADFALNPVKRGSGSNVKIFEYLAAQLPILSTPFGVRGTDLRAHRDYVPMSISTLRECLQSLNEPLAAGSWKEFAQAAWLRHADQCDMTSIVKVQWKLLLNSLALDQAT